MVHIDGGVEADGGEMRRSVKEQARGVKALL
jgi:hypothetical protein